MTYSKEALIGQINTGVEVTFTPFFTQSNVFSQFYYSPFKANIKGVIRNFTCMEQYMMYMKAVTFDDVSAQNMIMATPYNPKKYKAFGRRVKPFDPVIWDQVNTAILLEGNRMKFTQNKNLYNQLLNTGDTILVETSPFDKKWGAGINNHDKRLTNPAQWPGENRLGFILTELRDQFKDNQL